MDELNDDSPLTIDDLPEDLRAIHAQIIAEFKQLPTSLPFDQLLDICVAVIHRHFDLYSANIYLLEDSGEWITLRAASQDAIKIVISRGHKLRANGDSLVGRAIQIGQGVLAFAEEKPSHPFPSSPLPPVVSELFVPLRTKTKNILGILAIQSTEYYAFSKMDLFCYQSIADHFANILSPSQ